MASVPQPPILVDAVRLAVRQCGILPTVVLLMKGGAEESDLEAIRGLLQAAGLDDIDLDFGLHEAIDILKSQL